jgi:hypothetical protein
MKLYSLYIIVVVVLLILPKMQCQQNDEEQQEYEEGDEEEGEEVQEEEVQEEVSAVETDDFIHPELKKKKPKQKKKRLINSLLNVAAPLLTKIPFAGKINQVLIKFVLNFIFCFQMHFLQKLHVPLYFSFQDPLLELFATQSPEIHEWLRTNSPNFLS